MFGMYRNHELMEAMNCIMAFVVN